MEDIRYCFQPERRIPVASNVDVAVIGGSLGGEAAAVKAAQSGARVFYSAEN